MSLEASTGRGVKEVCCGRRERHADRGIECEVLVAVDADRDLLAAGVGGTVMLALPGVPLPVAAAPWVLAGLGMGLTYPTLSLLVLDLAPREVQGTAASALQVSDAVAAAAALAGTGALLWALHDVVGLTAYAVCLGLAAALALLVAALAGRTSVTSAGPGSSRVVEPAGAHPGEHVGGTDENHVTPGSTPGRPASAGPS